uniref:Uncharacterized protein n=1 Tax=Cacopsylla melanoneura TaxID=428564 RepID=A0A8D8Y4T9_9HEMI
MGLRKKITYPIPNKKELCTLYYSLFNCFVVRVGYYVMYCANRKPCHYRLIIFLQLMTERGLCSLFYQTRKIWSLLPHSHTVYRVLSSLGFEEKFIFWITGHERIK